MTLPWSGNAVPRPSPGQIPVLLEKKYVLGLALTEDEESTIKCFAKPEHYCLMWSRNAVPRPSPAQILGLLEKKYLPGLALTEGEESTIECFAKPEHYSSLLDDMCEWDSVSLESLSPLLENMKEIMPAKYWSSDPRPVFSLCANKHVSFELFELLLGYFPNAASFTSSQFCYAGKRSQDWHEQYFSGDANLLHVACANEYCPDSILDFLLKSNPSALLTKCVLGYGTHNLAPQDGAPPLHQYIMSDGTPLHYLLRMRPVLRLSTIQMLMNCDEAVLRTMGVSYRFGDNEIAVSPLDCLVWNESIDDMIDILRYVLRIAKEQGLTVVNGRTGQSALHQICKNPKATRQAVGVILEEFPDLATRSSIDDDHAVHDLCRNKRLNVSESIRILDLLVESDPDCSLCINVEGTLPLHLAAGSKSVGFIKHLVDLYPQAVRERNGEGREPLYYAFLFDADPETICVGMREDNRLPIELVPDTCPGQRLFLEQQMKYYRLSQDIKALSTSDQLGELELHRAVQSKATLGAIKLLVKGYPSAPQVANANGDHPLHIACARLDGSEVVTYLLAQHPPALSARNGEGLLPLHILCSTRAEHEDTESSFLSLREHRVHLPRAGHIPRPSPAGELVHRPSRRPLHACVCEPRAVRVALAYRRVLRPLILLEGRVARQHGPEEL
ncbi:hypothetical protein THAOC_17462, partial [Thalassiosira oceanica]